jgi:hypothetical protein
MNFLVFTIRIITIPLAIIGMFTVIILVGIPILGLVKDLNLFADKLEKKMYY